MRYSNRHTRILLCLSIVSLIIISSNSACAFQRSIQLIEGTEDISRIDIIPEPNTVDTFNVSQKLLIYFRDSITDNYQYDYQIIQNVVAKDTFYSTLEWTIDFPFFNFQIFTQKLFEAVYDYSEPFTIRFKMNNSGELLEIVNCQEFNSWIQSAYALNDELADKLRDEKQGIILTYGSRYQGIYDKEGCQAAKNILRMTFYDIFSFFHGIPFSTKEPTYISIQDTTEIISHYWQTAGHKQVNAESMGNDMIEVEDVYLPEWPEPIKKFLGIVDKDIAEARREEKALLDSLIKAIGRELREFSENDSLNNDQRSQSTDLRNTEKFTYYDSINPFKRQMVYDSKNKNLDELITERNRKLESPSINRYTMRRRIFKITRVK